MNVFVSSGAFSKIRNLEDLLVVCSDHNIDFVELASGLQAHEQYSETLKINDNIKYLLHNYFPAPAQPFVLNLADSDSVNRHRSIKFVEQALKVCSDCSIPFYSVHAGFVASMRPEDLGKPERQKFQITYSQYDLALQLFSKSIGELSPLATRLGVKLLVENNFHAVPGVNLSHLLLSTTSDILSFFEQHSMYGVGLLLDVAHLKVSSHHLSFDPYASIEALSPWVSALHLSDNDGCKDTNDPCRPDSWFWSPLNYNCSGAVTPILESYRLQPDEIKSQIELISTTLKFPTF